MTSMHDSPHAQRIAFMVQRFKTGIFEEDIQRDTCAACNRPLQNPLQCSRCKIIKYCNAACQNKDWYGTPAGQPHRDVCKLIQKLPDTEPQMRAIAQQFPWARIQSDGTFSFVTLRASRSLLGCGGDFGWWTEKPCCAKGTPYLYGFLLLERQHLRERAGWNLSDKEIPWLDFSLGGKPPKLPSFEQNWLSYYEWRGLPIESPAVLLLHWPLTVYRLLHILGLAPASPPEKRRKLLVHMLGVEKEVDFLPIFGELALLLPNTDLDLIMFGSGATNIITKASRDSECLASQPFAYTYSAPKVSGGGTIRIGLSRGGPLWVESSLARQGLTRPDAMIACNAGLSTYPDWRPVVIASRAFSIPFAVTDYNEISLHNDISLVFEQLPGFSRIIWSGGVLTPEEQRRIDETPKYNFKIRLNPFMQPGPKPKALGGISAVNGYEMIVTSIVV